MSAESEERKPLDTSLDSKAENEAVEAAAGGSPSGLKIPGSLWKEPSCGRFFWRIKSALIPPNLRGKGAYTNVPLIPTGQKFSTRGKGLAVRVRARLWRHWHTDNSLAGANGLDDLIRQFGTHNALRASAHTVSVNCSILQAFCKHVEATGLKDLTDAAIVKYLAAVKKTGRSDRTIQKHRAAISQFCGFLYRKGHLDHNPADSVAVKTPAKLPPRFLNDQQAQAFLDRLASPDTPKWLAVAGKVALYAGPRMGSLRMMRGEHIGAGGLIVPLPKQGDYCVVPYTSKFGAELKAALDTLGPVGRQDRLFPDMTPDRWVDHLAAVTKGLPVFGELPGRRSGNQWHLLRATWAVNCARLGATQWELMEWGGWKVPLTVLRYVNIARAAGR